jgi:hypothetical protein
MFNDTELPKSSLDGPDIGSQTDDQAPAAAPPRFGRLAMCVGAASALVIGVMGTVAYGVWFNHDQQAYADAMVDARKALGGAAPATTAVMAKTASVAALPAATTFAKSAGPSSAPAQTGATAAPALPASGKLEEGGRLASWSGQVTRSAAPPAQRAAVAKARSAAPAEPAPFAVSGRRTANAANAANPSTQQLASARPGKDGRAAPQERRTASANSKHKGSLFARIGLFFRRVNYRQHGNGSRQDIYSHP